MSEDFIAVSGGFDPIHHGHISLINDAAAFGKVVVILNTDEWLKRKKGYVFMPFEQRKKVLENIRNVHVVLQAFDDDGTVCKNLSQLRMMLSYFGNGGDRNAKNTPELELCDKLEITPIFGLGGGKVQSSSTMVNKCLEQLNGPGDAGMNTLETSGYASKHYNSHPTDQ